jgi:LmbE family N-acetylglucosaminyl deacetylase
MTILTHTTSEPPPRAASFHRLIHPRALLHSLLTYPRYLGTIKPELLRRSRCELQVLDLLRSCTSCWWPRVLQPPLGKRILVCSPHPDDESIGAGGFLLRHRGRVQLHLLSVFSGEQGGRLAVEQVAGPHHPKEALAAERQREFAVVAGILGADFSSLMFPEGQIHPLEDSLRRFGEVVAAFRPDVVLLPWLLDGHPDHRLTNVVYGWSCAHLDCMVLGYEVWTMLSPNAVLDISGDLQEKLQLISCYKTQRSIDYAGFCSGLARTRAFYQPTSADRGGAAEAFLALPNREYCELVRAVYGEPFRFSESAAELLSLKMAAV